VWMIGTIDSWDAARPLLEKLMAKANLDALTSVRAFAFDLQLDDDVKLDAAFQSRDEASAEALRSLLAQATGSAYLKVLGPEAGGEKVAAELAKNLKSKREGSWVLLETSASAATVQQAVKP
jgi:hypothetical protein